MNKELSKTLAAALVQWLDKARPEGTMCCSNAECESIEQMFEGGCYDVVEEFIKKKLEVPLTPFQQCLNGILRKVYFAEVSDPTSFIIKCIQYSTKELLELAKKQLLSYADESNPAIEAMTDLERTFECNPDKLPKWLKEALADYYQKGFDRGRKWRGFNTSSGTLKAEG